MIIFDLEIWHADSSWHGIKFDGKGHSNIYSHVKGKTAKVVSFTMTKGFSSFEQFSYEL